MSGSGLECGYTICRLSAIMERFDEVDLSGHQVPSNDSIAPSGSHDDTRSSHSTKSHDTKSHDARSHDAKSHDARSHDAILTPASKQLPVGKPPSGSVSKIDTLRVAGVFTL